MLQAFWSHDKTNPQTNSCTALPVLDLAMRTDGAFGESEKMILYSRWAYEGEVITNVCPLWLQVPYPTLGDQILSVFSRLTHLILSNYSLKTK